MSAGGLARLGVRCADASTGIATLGIFCGSLLEPVSVPPVVDSGSGRSAGIRRDGYRKTYQDDLLETRRKRILREDEELSTLIVAMITRDLL